MPPSRLLAAFPMAGGQPPGRYAMICLRLLVEYSVVLHKAEEGGFWVEVPALPGCYSQGESPEEALANVKEAIELYIDVLREDGQPIPRDEEVVFKVIVAA